jgi:hypothetical protein
MARTDKYDRLKADYAENGAELERKVLAALKDAPAGVTRQSLVQRIFGVRPGNLSASTQDRAVREAIASLSRQGVPVISSSGAAGYKLARDDTDFEEALKETRSRVAKLQERERALEQARLAMQKRAAERQPQWDKATQETLWRE